MESMTHYSENYDLQNKGHEQYNAHGAYLANMWV